MPPSVDSSPAIISVAEIKTLLEAGDFERLIGIREGCYFEAKPKHPFDLALGKKANVSIAKYLASFANNEGGIVVFGLAVESQGTLRVDVVTSLDLFLETEFYEPDEFIARGQDAIYPKLADLVAKWYPSKANPALGLGALFIPQQDERKKYFMIVGNKEMDDEEVAGQFYGVPIRNEAQTDWLSASRMHELSLQRPNTWQQMGEDIFEQLDRIEERISTNASQPVVAPPKTFNEEVQKLINQVFKTHD